MSSSPQACGRIPAAAALRQSKKTRALALGLSALALLLAPGQVIAQQSSSSSSGATYAPPLATPPSTGATVATATSSSSGGTAGGTDFNSVCGQTLSEAANPTAADNASLTFTQKVQYCQAAQQALKAAGDDGLLWKVWAGVAGVCTTACITSFISHASLGLVCTGTNVAASVTDAVVTKNFSDALTGLGMAAISVATKKLSKGHDFASCLTAATATMQVFSKRSDEKSQNATANTNVGAAIQLSTLASGSSGNPGSPVVVVPTQNTTPLTSTANTATSTPLTVEKGVTNLAQTGAGSACGGQTAGEHFACALAKDSTLPGFVTSPGFSSELAKNSGLEPDQFLNSGQTPAQAILGASGGAGLNAQGVQTYSGMLGDLAKQFDSETPTAVYAGGGGGGARSGGDDGAGMSTLVAGLMKSLNPHAGDDKEKEDGNSLNVVFQGANRGPAYNADDPAFSIFDRVSYRYRTVSPRLIQ